MDDEGPVGGYPDVEFDRVGTPSAARRNAASVFSRSTREAPRWAIDLPPHHAARTCPDRGVDRRRIPDGVDVTVPRPALHAEPNCQCDRNRGVKVLCNRDALPSVWTAFTGRLVCASIHKLGSSAPPTSAQETCDVSILASSLVLANADYDWRRDAICRDTDPDLFFPVGTTGNALVQIDEPARSASSARAGGVSGVRARDEPGRRHLGRHLRGGAPRDPTAHRPPTTRPSPSSDATPQRTPDEGTSPR